MKICNNKNCCADNPDNARFCSKCGKEIVDIQDSDTGSKIIETVLLIAAVIAGLIWLPGWTKFILIGSFKLFVEIWK